jgi:signal transduction histidine kinase
MFVHAQNLSPKTVDSLTIVVEQLKPDTQKVNKLFTLCLKLNRSHVPKAIEKLAIQAKSISQKLNYKKGLGFTSFIFGFLRYSDRNYVDAISFFKEAQQILNSCNDQVNIGYCYHRIANVQYDLGNYYQSILEYENALKQWNSCGYNVFLGECSNDLALSYARMGNFNKAIEWAYSGYRESEKKHDKSQMAQSLHLLGSTFFEFKNHENAIKNLTAASTIYEELHDDFGLARNNNMIGEVMLDKGNSIGALQKFKEAFVIYNRPEAPSWGLPWVYSNIASVYESQGDSANNVNKQLAKSNYELALENYLLSLQKFKEIKDPAGSTEQLQLVGRIYFKIKNITKAKQYFDQSLKVAQQTGEKRHLSFTHLYLSKIYAALNNSTLSYSHYKQHIIYRDSVYNLQSSQTLLAYKAQMDVEKKDNEIALLETENKLQKVLSEKKSQGRNFAYLIAVLLLIGGVYGYFRFKKQSKIKGEQKLLKERLAISQDLHDSIGSTLSSIAVYSQVAKIHGAKNEQEDMNELLERISTASGETVVEMNDIVWALNPQNDSMEKIVQRMESFAKPLAAARNIHFNFMYDASLLQLSLEMNIRKNLYLIFKEAVNNSIKYSGAKELNISLLHKQQMLELKVNDDGVGFNIDTTLQNKQSSLSGNGINNLYKRAAEINGQLSIQSIVNNGTAITLLFPFTVK